MTEDKMEFSPQAAAWAHNHGYKGETKLITHSIACPGGGHPFEMTMPFRADDGELYVQCKECGFLNWVKEVEWEEVPEVIKEFSKKLDLKEDELELEEE